jgi:hypothetical protein
MQGVCEQEPRYAFDTNVFVVSAQVTGCAILFLLSQETSCYWHPALVLQ